LANVILRQAKTDCGCISVMTEHASTTIRYGRECSDRCGSFVGCPRARRAEAEKECECPDCQGGDEESPHGRMFS
jgi:hypothetical protein